MQINILSCPYWKRVLGTALCQLCCCAGEGSSELIFFQVVELQQQPVEGFVVWAIGKYITNP